jgi:hypothetical protein
MQYTREDINDFFSMFHDFEIIELQYTERQLTMIIVIPWGLLWDDDDYRIKVIVEDCKYLTCNYATYTDSTRTEPIDKETDDCSHIAALNLWVQECEFFEPDQYGFFCDSHTTGLAAQLKLTANNIIILDKHGNVFELKKMKELASQWWDSIQQMWDEQNKDLPKNSGSSS